MTNSDCQLAQSAEKAVREALDALRKSRAADGRVLRENGHDIKLEADMLLNNEITRRLTEATGIACVSEEDAASHGLPESGAAWIVDPLDGSMNFSRGLPLYCVSVALWRDGAPAVGLIHDVERDRTHMACDGTARVNGQPMRVNPIQDISRAVLATGFPVLTDTSPAALEWFLSFADRFKKTRMLGTAALSMAWVAEGKMDAYFEKDIMIWDVAAGAALVREAGGVCLMRPGNHHMSRDVLAANPNLAETMREILGWN